jgi:REP element-mobilizing transposase RayT
MILIKYAKKIEDRRSGALHHIIVRGIERRKIFQDNSDRDNFLGRLAGILQETETRCYAWALIPNHFHLLLKTGSVPIATVMRRLLTGYAVSYNRKRRRHGHLFQNRYKSILCQEDAYLKELVRYIHLNPLRARMVSDIKNLDKYPYAGHSAILGKITNSWQDVDGILGLFADKVSLARRGYRSFVQKGVNQGKRQDLTGGGLIRSSGGWSNVKAMRRANLFQKSDERILGDGDFVEKVLSESREKMDRKYAFHARGITVDNVFKIAANLMNIEPKLVFAPGKERTRVQARSLFCYWSVRELGISMTKLSRQLNISLSAVSLSVKRGEQIVTDNKYSLIDLLKQ